MSTSAKYIVLSALPLLFAACNKENAPGPSASVHPITVGFDAVQTKTLMRSSDLENANTQLVIYGYDGSATPVFDGLTATPPVSGEEESGTVRNWTIAKAGVDGNYAPAWEDDKEYAFFSWVGRDASGKTASGLFPGMTYTKGATAATLDIPETALSIDEGTMDFCYSDVVTRSTSTTTADKVDYSMVQMTLEHLFAAFSLSAHNYTDSPITITSVKLKGLHNKKSAVVTFSAADGSEAVYTSNAATTDQELVSDASGVSLNAGAGKQNIAKGSGTTAKYFLMWPQTEAEISAAASKLSVTYSIGGGASQTKEMAIPYDKGAGWPAGVCQNIELSFTKKTLSITVKPMPWNQTEPDYDYEGAATVLGILTLADGYINPTGTKNVYFKSAFEPIILEFKIGTPLNASWMVEKIGDFDAFEIDNITPETGTGVSGDGIDTKEGIINGETARIAISPKIHNPQKDYKIQLSFAVRGNNGTVMDINGLTATTGVQGGTDKSDWYTFYILK